MELVDCNCNSIIGSNVRSYFKCCYICLNRIFLQTERSITYIAYWSTLIIQVRTNNPSKNWNNAPACHLTQKQAFLFHNALKISDSMTCTLEFVNLVHSYRKRPEFHVHRGDNVCPEPADPLYHWWAVHLPHCTKTDFSNIQSTHQRLDVIVGQQYERINQNELFWVKRMWREQRVERTRKAIPPASVLVNSC